MHCVYILFSSSVDRYYIGETKDLTARLKEHNQRYFFGSYTAIAQDWEVYLKIECESVSQAKKLEAFIKRMKSRKFIEKLKASPVIADEIKKRF